MKRSGFLKRKTGLKRGGKLRKKSKQKISLLQRKLWEECRRICYNRDKKSDGSIDCFTCDSPNITGSNRQLGHLWAKASLGAYLKYDIRILRWQCMRCNQFMGGMGADFYRRLSDKIGYGEMAKLVLARQVTVKAYDHYEKLLKEIEQ